MPAEMTDLELTRLCAEAMGFNVLSAHSAPASNAEFCMIGGNGILPFAYNPLHDDAQAMQLVKKFPMVIEPEYNEVGENSWGITCLRINKRGRFAEDSVVRHAFDLNRAIVECCANMQKAKTK